MSAERCEAPARVLAPITLGFAPAAFGLSLVMTVLRGKQIILGVTGSVAAFKGAVLASELTKRGSEVRVVLTSAAERFVTRQTFTGLTGVAALASLWEEATEPSSGHIALAAWADAIVVAPATANTIGRMASGLADDLLGAVLLASPAPVLVAPAMEGHMYLHPATQANLGTLRVRGVTIVGPVHGRLASGQEATGRMSEPAELIVAIEALLSECGRTDFQGIHLVVTAGPTREPIDPVRYISNRSSGKMGYQLAAAAARRGGRVTLVSGPVDDSIRCVLPSCVHRIEVETAGQMLEAVLEASSGANAVVMAAAVADFRPASVPEHKIKKSGASAQLSLEPTQDILEALQSQRPGVLRVGFAAETKDLTDNAGDKLQRKDLAMIVANQISTSGPSVFGADLNAVTIMRRDGVRVELPTLPKADVADAVLDNLHELLAAKQSK